MKTIANFKLVSIISMFFFLIFNSNAQTPDWDWAKTAGGADSDRGYSVSTDITGNVLVAGNFSSPTITFGSYTLNNQGSADMYLVKYDSNGNVLWAKSAGGAENEIANSVTTDAVGNIYVVGYFVSTSIDFGTGALANTSSNFKDMFIVKYDPNGNALWAKSAGGIYHDEAYDVATDTAGNVVVSGTYITTINFGTGALSGNGNYEAFVVKYNASGTAQWAKSQGTIDEDRAYCVATDNSGNVVVAGTFKADITIGNTTLTYAGGAYEDIYLVKYDANGTIVWVEGAGGTYRDKPDGIAIDDSGNIYMTGIIYSEYIIFGPDSLPNSGFTFYGDFFLVKYDASGDVQWADGAGSGSNNDWGSDVVVDFSGNILVTGLFGSTITFGSSTLTGGGIFVVQYDNAGNVLWDLSVPDGLGNSIAEDSNGNIYIAGSHWTSSITFGSTTLTNAGGYDMFVAKLSAPLSATLAQSNVSCFTNCDGTSEANVQGGVSPYTYLWDANAGNQTNASATGLCAGTYLVTVTDAANDTLQLAVTISEPSLLTGSIIQTTADFGNCNGDATVTPTGGTPNYSYLWDDTGSQTTATASGLCGGTYCVTITDSNACTWVTCIDVLSVGINDQMSSFSLSLFPNPTTGRFMLQSNQKGQFTITDLRGRQVATGQHNQEFNLSSQPKGVYFIRSGKSTFMLLLTE